MRFEATVMNRRQFLNAVGVVATLPVGLFAAGSAPKNRRPNFVFIFADDLGWAAFTGSGRASGEPQQDQDWAWLLHKRLPKDTTGA